MKLTTLQGFTDEAMKRMADGDFEKEEVAVKEHNGVAYVIWEIYSRNTGTKSYFAVSATRKKTGSFTRPEDAERHIKSMIDKDSKKGLAKSSQTMIDQAKSRALNAITSAIEYTKDYGEKAKVDVSSMISSLKKIHWDMP